VARNKATRPWWEQAAERVRNPASGRCRSGKAGTSTITRLISPNGAGTSWEVSSVPCRGVVAQHRCLVQRACNTDNRQLNRLVRCSNVSRWSLLRTSAIPSMLRCPGSRTRAVDVFRGDPPHGGCFGLCCQPLQGRRPMGCTPTPVGCASPVVTSVKGDCAARTSVRCHPFGLGASVFGLAAGRWGHVGFGVRFRALRPQARHKLSG
jgi:hypothetical protein